MHVFPKLRNEAFTCTVKEAGLLRFTPLRFPYPPSSEELIPTADVKGFISLFAAIPESEASGRGTLLNVKKFTGTLRHGGTVPLRLRYAAQTRRFDSERLIGSEPRSCC